METVKFRIRPIEKDRLEKAYPNMMWSHRMQFVCNDLQASGHLPAEPKKKKNHVEERE
jgi:hypothetical protein